MTTLVVLQPGYLPWLGFFNQMARSDIFVYYDDVQYDKHGWRNRNRIKSGSGPIWLSVPVYNSGKLGQRILDVEIDNRMPWARKHVTAIRQNYSKAPYLRDYLPQLEDLLCRGWRKLVDLDIAVAELMCRWFSLKRDIHRSSELGISGEKSERLLNICRKFNATNYLSGDSAQSYLDVNLFLNNGITVEWQNFAHPTYPQQHGVFVPYLSALDLVMNAGPSSLNFITGRNN